MSTDQEIWYGPCGFWTDDWSKLSTITMEREYQSGEIQARSGIPCCPKCKAPGFQSSKADWEKRIAELNKTYPLYDRFIQRTKNVCSGRGYKLRRDYGSFVAGYLSAKLEAQGLSVDESFYLAMVKEAYMATNPASTTDPETLIDPDLEKKIALLLSNDEVKS